MRNIVQRQWRAWKEGREDGFTLIELLVVLLILGILLGIAIPTFLAVTHSAGTATAESNLDTALTTADSYYESNQQSFSGLMSSGGAVSNLNNQGGNLNFTSTNSTGEKSISVAWGDQTASAAYTGQLVGLAALNSNGNSHCYVIIDVKQTLSTTGLGSVKFDAQGSNGTGADLTHLVASGATSIPAGTYYGWFSTGGTSQQTPSTCTPQNALSGTNNVAQPSASNPPGAWTTAKFPAG